MRRPRAVALAGTVSALALVAAACGSDSGDGGNGGSGNSGSSTQPVELTSNVTNPQNPLMPGNTGEVEGATLLDMTYSKLVSYDPETGDVEMDIAESIESEDNMVWEITLKEGWEFSNGEPVDADAFIRAWNYVAYAPNGQLSAEFFQLFEGFEDVHPAPEDGEEEPPKPAAEKMSGLEKTGDYSFTVTLTEPFVGFVNTLGYLGYAPVAEACLADVEACGKQPIGNGPFVFEEPFVPDDKAVLVKNEDYAGEEEAKLDKVTFRVIADLETVRNELDSGGIDLARSTPPEARDDIRATYPDGFVEEPTSRFTFLGFPSWEDAFSDPRVEQALSMAVDRQLIIDQVLAGAGTPATAFIPPHIPGHREDACEWCVHDPDAAQDLLDEAGGWPSDKPLKIYFNAGAGHESWTEAVGNQIRQNLGIEFQLEPVDEWGDYLNMLAEKEIDGPFRAGWSMAYPYPEYALAAVYTTSGSSNYSGYDNPDFDAAMVDAATADSAEDAITGYQEAEDLLFDDPPVMPLWYGVSSVAFRDNVGDVTYSVPRDQLLWSEITVTE